MRALSGIIWNLAAVSAGAVLSFGINSVSLSKEIPSGERGGQLGGFSNYLGVRSYLEKERLAGLARFKKEKQLAERERQLAVEAYRREKSHQAKELTRGQTNDQKKAAYQEYIQGRFKDSLEMERVRRGFVAKQQLSQRRERKMTKEVDEHFLSEHFPRVDWGRRGLFSNSTGFSLSPPLSPNDPHDQWNSGTPPSPFPGSGSEMEPLYPSQPADPQNWNSPYLPAPPSAVFEDEEPPF